MYTMKDVYEAWDRIEKKMAVPMFDSIDKEADWIIGNLKDDPEADALYQWAWLQSGDSQAFQRFDVEALIDCGENDIDILDRLCHNYGVDTLFLTDAPEKVAAALYCLSTSETVNRFLKEFLRSKTDLSKELIEMVPEIPFTENTEISTCGIMNFLGYEETDSGHYVLSGGYKLAQDYLSADADDNEWLESLTDEEKENLVFISSLYPEKGAASYRIGHRWKETENLARIEQPDDFAGVIRWAAKKK